MGQTETPLREVGFRLSPGLVMVSCDGASHKTTIYKDYALLDAILRLIQAVLSHYVSRRKMGFVFDFGDGVSYTMPILKVTLASRRPSLDFGWSWSY